MNNGKTNIVNQEIWDDSYDDIKDIDIDSANKSSIGCLIKKYIPPNNGSCVEIGCFPGRFLAVFGGMGYTLYGIDTTPHVTKVPEWLKKHGYKVGVIENKDFLQFDPKRKYDVVYSCGFVEHFTNWEDIIKKHMELVDINGYILITTPNYRGFIQRYLRSMLQNYDYKMHVIESMNPEAWRKIAKENNFNIIFCGYIGGFQYLYLHQSDKNLLVNILRYILYMLGYFGRYLPNNGAYSTYCALIATKYKM